MTRRDRARFEALLEHRLLPVFVPLRLLEVLETDRHDLGRRVAEAASAPRRTSASGDATR